jgi:hypothetical protein
MLGMSTKRMIQTTDGGTLYKQMLINEKLETRKRSKNRADWENPLRRQKSALDCSAI